VLVPRALSDYAAASSARTSSYSPASTFCLNSRVDALDGDAEGDAGADDFLRRVLGVVSEQVGLLLFGDLFDLFDGEVGDEVLLGLAGPGVEAGLVFDHPAVGGTPTSMLNEPSSS